MYMPPEILERAVNATYKGVAADIFSLGVILWILHFGSPPFLNASSTDRNYTILQKNVDAFWRLHPAVRKYQGGEIDSDFKQLLVGMLSIDPVNRPETIDSVMSHAFFTKENDLITPTMNKWADSEAMYTAF